MSYDPSLPLENTEIDAAQMRGQLQGLKALIDAVASINAAQVDGVTTGAPADPAQAAVSVVGNTLHFTFTLPRGNDGATGDSGAPGPPFANAVTDPVTTLPPGSPATVSVSLVGTDVHFTFGIPNGQQGVPGADGPPGEVTNAALAMSISGTSSNSNAVPTMDTPFANDPPTLADMETMRAAYNALVLVLRR